MTLHDPSQSGRGSGQTGETLIFIIIDNNWMQLVLQWFFIYCVIIQWGHSMVGICWDRYFC